MVLNSNVISNNTATSDDSESPTSKVLVNTTDFTNGDLEEFVNMSERIEHVIRERRSQGRRCKSRANTMIVATKVREELFESISMDNDEFLKAMEHQTSYDTEKKQESFVKYFDEDMRVFTDSSGRSSPANKTPKGKVAAAVAAFRSRYRTIPSPLSRRKKVQSNILELRKKYESSTETEATPSPKIKSPKLTRKNKVKQMALLFNQKINKMVKNTTPLSKTVESESSGLESVASTNLNSTLKTKSPKFTSKFPNFVTKLASPKPSPFFKRKSQSLKKTSSVSSLASSNSPIVKRKNLQKQRCITCLVAENVFSQLSVKDKVLLYNKFIEDMSKKNPKFQKHAEILESNVKKEVQRGEVIIENQNRVKHIRDSIEARLTPTKPLSKTLPGFKRTSRSPLVVASKSKEYEDILQSGTCSPLPLAAESQDLLHFSSLTVVLKPTPQKKKSMKKLKASSQGKKKKDVTFDASVVEPACKRTQNMIRCSFPVEPLAPPKKIRRTLNERLAPYFFFQNQDLEKLFFQWLKQKNGVAFDITPVDNKENCIEIVAKNTTDNDLPQEEVEKILEAAVKQFEKERKDKSPINSVKGNAVVLIKSSIDDKIDMEKSIIEVELPLEEQISNNSTKEMNECEDLNLGLTSLTKTTSEESQAELTSLEISTSLTKHSRKKKLRRALILKTSTTDSSDSEGKTARAKQQLNCTLPKSKKCSNYVKRLIFKTLHGSSATTAAAATPATAAEEHNQTVCSPEQNIYKLDDSLMRQANSPSKIKDAYTLTIISSPSPPTESEYYDSDLPRTPIQKFSESGTSLQEAEAIENTKLINQETKKVIDTLKSKHMTDSFIDQGFETGTTETDSPLRVTKLSQEKPLNFSTPCKDQQEFNAQIGFPNQSILSPISNSASLKMTSIKEDNTLADSEEFHCTPSFLNESATCSATEQLSANRTDSPLSSTSKVASSQFWIASGNFTAALTIDHYDSEKLMLLNSIFVQKTMETRDMSFGIDDQIFSYDSSTATNDKIKNVPREDDCSQYWFATGNVLIPFTGRLLNTQKIQSFFNYIREFVDDTASLRFGIDGYEFSYILGHASLQQSSANTPIKVTDLDQSESEREQSEPNLTISTPSGQHSNNVSLRNDDFRDQKISQSTCAEESDSLERIFENVKLLYSSKTQNEHVAPGTQFTIAEILEAMKIQKDKLESIADRMRSCDVDKAAPKLMGINNSSEYMRKLRSIISAIENIGRGSGFNACTIDQLESFMFFLSHYADICLTTSNAYIEKLLDVVSTQRSTLNV